MEDRACVRTGGNERRPFDEQYFGVQLEKREDRGNKIGSMMVIPGLLSGLWYAGVLRKKQDACERNKLQNVVDVRCSVLTPL
jgi:hypothetical protein